MLSYGSKILTPNSVIQVVCCCGSHKTMAHRASVWTPTAGTATGPQHKQPRCPWPRCSQFGSPSHSKQMWNSLLFCMVYGLWAELVHVAVENTGLVSTHGPTSGPRVQVAVKHGLLCNAPVTHVITTVPNWGDSAIRGHVTMSGHIINGYSRMWEAITVQWTEARSIAKHSTRHRSTSNGH